MTIKTSMGNITAKKALLFTLSVGLKTYANELKEEGVEIASKRYSRVATEMLLALDKDGYLDKELNK